MPKSRVQKEEVKDIIRGMKHKGAYDDENIGEALAHVFRAFSPARVSDDVLGIIGHDNAVVDENV